MFGYLVFYAWTSSARIHASSEIVVWSEDRIWRNLLFTAGVLAACAGIGALAHRAGDKEPQAAAVVMSLAVALGCGILAGAAHSYPSADQIYVYEAAVNFYRRLYQYSDGMIF